jgi:DNA-binding NtrC family response regulator
LKETLPATDLPLPEEGIDYQNVVYNIERNLLLEGLRRFGGNRSKTASYLNLKRTTLLEKMKRLKLSEWEEV